MHFYWCSGTIKKCRLSLLYSHPTLMCLPSVEGVYVAGVLCGLFIPVKFPFWAWSYSLTTLYFSPLTVQEHRFLTIIYKHVPKLFSGEDCANNHSLCISQADWKKKSLFSSARVQWYFFSNHKNCIMKKNPEIFTATLIMLLGPLIFINTSGNFWWRLPEWNSFPVKSTLWSVHTHIDT